MKKGTVRGGKGVTETTQKEFWTSRFARGYVRRNFCDARQVDETTAELLGTTRTRMVKEFLGAVRKDARILEVGTNVGNQLLHLRSLGFTNLYGIELNPAIAAAVRERLPWANVVAGDALDIPFKDGFFDLVFTSRVLIHVSPKRIRRALKEISRVSRMYVWGFEYFEKKYTEIPYHGNRNVLWKTDFPKLYKTVDPKLKLVRQKLYTHVNDAAKQDVMFLFRK